MPRDHHHVVSKGYQRAFADGKQILLIDKKSAKCRVVGIRHAFVKSGFNALCYAHGQDDALEDEWARLESAALPVVRAVADGADVDESADIEIKVLMAVHFARSFHTRQLYQDLQAAYRLNPAAVVDMPKLRAAYQRDFGRPPTDAEITETIQANLDAIYAENRLFVEGMVRAHNHMLEYLRPLHLQIVRTPPGPVEFITGDVPLVTSTNRGLRLRVPVMDADVVYFPIGRRCSVAVSTQPRESLTVNRVGVAKINRVIWRAALRFVACHPGTDWRRCLAFGPESLFGPVAPDPPTTPGQPRPQSP